MELDPHDLRFLGEIGHRDSWGDPSLDLGGILPFYLSSAHPVIDPDRGSHSITQTENFLVLADSGNFTTDAGEMSGGPRPTTIDRDAAVYILRKEAIEATPAGEALTPVCARVAPTTGHFYAQWGDEDGIRVVFEHMDLMDLGYKLEAGDLDANPEPVDPALVGSYNTAMGLNTCSEVVFHPVTGAGEQQAEFREDWTYNLELSAMVVGRYGYPDTGDHITSPSFVPRGANADGADAGRSRYAGAHPGGHDGYVVLPVLSDNGFRVEVFDAARVSAGPVATIASPHGECVPVVLHSAWMPTSPGAPDRERLAFSAELAREVAAELDAEHR